MRALAPASGASESSRREREDVLLYTIKSVLSDHRRGRPKPVAGEEGFPKSSNWN